MSRTQSQGIEFFPLAVDLFSDKKIKILKARYGADGIAIYLYLLCQVYREGYYTRVDADFKYMVSDDLNMASDKVEQVLAFLFERSMFDEQLFKSDAVLTSTGIQERWQKAVATRARKSPIEVGSYWLLKESETQPFIRCTHFSNSSEKKELSSEKKDLNSENYPQSKVKESKVNNNYGGVFKHVTCKDDTTPLERFIQRWGISCNGLSNYRAGKAGGMDWDAVSAKVEKSTKYLQKQKGIGFFIDHYGDILDGAYDDFDAPPPKKKIDPDFDGSVFADVEYEH